METGKWDNEHIAWRTDLHEFSVQHTLNSHI